MSLNAGSAVAVLLVLATLPLGGCSRASGDTSPLPNVASIVPSASSPVPSYSLPTGDAAQGGTGGAAGASSHGAETSPSTGTGPSNNSAAVGGMAGGQSTGGATGAEPAPTAGDGSRAAPK